MHGVVVNVTINDPEAAERALRGQAEATVPPAMTFKDVDVREVAAHA